MSDIVYFWYIFGHFTHFTPFYPFLPKCVIFAKNYITIIDIVLDHFQPNPQNQYSSKVQKPLFGLFWAILPLFAKCVIFAKKNNKNNRHHFRPFSAKSLDSIFFKSPKTSFLGYFGLFWAHLAQFGHKPDFFQKCDFRRMLEDHQIHHFQQKKSTHQWLRFSSKLEKPHFRAILGHFGPKFPNLGKRDFFRKIGLCHFSTFMVP